MDSRSAARLRRYAQSQHSSAVIVMRDGDTLVESYHHIEPDDEVATMFHGTDGSGQPREDVASIQKSIVALLIGVATTRGEFDPAASVSSYLGGSWCDAPDHTIHRITVEHLTAMSSGLDRDLRLRSEPLAEWDYNTRGYTKAREALEAATGRSVHAMTREWLCEPLDLSTTEWVTRTQNPSYGHFWWLNGQSFWIDTHGVRRPGPRLPNAPSDTVMAHGRFQRYLWVVPSSGLVAVPLGAEPAPDFADRFWSLLSETIQL